MNDEASSWDFDTLKAAIEEARQNAPLRFRLDIIVDDEYVPGIEVAGRTSGNIEDDDLSMELRLTFDDSPDDKQRLERFYAWAEKPRFVAKSDNGSSEFNYETGNSDDEMEKATKLLVTALQCLYGYRDDIEPSFDYSSVDCPYCDYDEECNHLFAMREFENYVFESEWISEEELNAQVPDEALLQVFSQIQKHHKWYDKLSESKKNALFEGDNMDRVTWLVELACQENDTASDDADELNMDLWNESDPGYLYSLFEECPHLLELRRVHYGDCAAQSTRTANYWTDEPQQALKWIQIELKEDSDRLSTIAERISKATKK